MLCLERLAAEYVGGADHGDKVFAGHRRPELVEEGAVVDADGGSHDLGKAVPVLSGALTVGGGECRGEGLTLLS